MGTARRSARPAIVAIIAIVAFVAFLACPLCIEAAAAATKLDEGFATRSANGHLRTGLSRGKAGDDVIYWIQWQDLDPRTSVHCAVRKGNASGELVLDEDGEIDSDEDGTFSVCGTETESGDAGDYWFAQTIAGEQVGARTIHLDEDSWWADLSMRRKWKYLAGALAGVVLGVLWVRKKLGKGNEIDAVMGGDREAKLARAGVVIGSKLEEPRPAAAPPPQPPKPSGEEAYQAFKKRLADDKAARVAQPEDVLPIAKAARAAGDANTAIAAVRGFDKAFPGNPLIPDVFVFTAKVLAEDLKNADMARKILEHIVAKYPGHYLAPEAKRILQSLPSAVG